MLHRCVSTCPVFMYMCNVIGVGGSSVIIFSPASPVLVYRYDSMIKKKDIYFMVTPKTLIIVVNSCKIKQNLLIKKQSHNIKI